MTSVKQRGVPLIIGSAGQLGTALRNILGDWVAPPRSEFDIVRDDIAPLLEIHVPRAVINCAAFHNVDQCERDVESAFAANAIAVDRIAAACAERDITFVTISTDYVFSGAANRAYIESDSPDPRTAYGTSKLAGELLTRHRGIRSIIVRTSGVFGTIGSSSKGYTLIDKVLGQAERGEATRMVADMTFSPSYAPHVARAIVELIERDAFGTHHVINQGSCTWYEFVQSAFAKAGLQGACLEAISYAALGNPTQRPLYSPLENTTFAKFAMQPLPTWQAAIDEYLAARRARIATASSA